MALENIAVILILVTILYGTSISKAAVYSVGDSTGWNVPENINYEEWAADKKFYAGDTLVFEYNPQYHNVLAVKHQNFESCNATLPISTYASGRDSIILKNSGPFYFMCGFPGHCQAGQKFHVKVY